MPWIIFNLHPERHLFLQCQCCKCNCTNQKTATCTLPRGCWDSLLPLAIDTYSSHCRITNQWKLIWTQTCCHERRRSITRVVLKINGAPIHWQLKSQTLVALSSAEAEHIAMPYCWKENISLHRSFLDLCNHNLIIAEPCIRPTKICTDNTSAISLITSPAISERNNYIDLNCHLIKDLYNKKVVSRTHTRTII